MSSGKPAAKRRFARELAGGGVERSGHRQHHVLLRDRGFREGVLPRRDQVFQVALRDASPAKASSHPAGAFQGRIG